MSYQWLPSFLLEELLLLSQYLTKERKGRGGSYVYRALNTILLLVIAENQKKDKLDLHFRSNPYRQFIVTAGILIKIILRKKKETTRHANSTAER